MAGTEWMKVGMDVVTGAGVGAIDQVVQNLDDKRADEKSKLLPTPETLELMSQYGTYLNFGVPLLTIVATAMGWVRGEWATRLATSASQLAGRKIVHKFTKEKELPGYPSYVATYSRAPTAEWKRAGELEARRAQELAAARAREAHRGGGAAPQISEWEIPVISGGVILA